MACVRKRRGKWVLDYRERCADGRKRRRWETFERERDAKARRREIEDRGEGEAAPADPDVTVLAYSQEWLKAIGPYVKPRTVECYTWALDRHIVPILGFSMVRRVSRSQVKRLVTGLLAAGKSRNTVRIIHATLHALLGEALEDGIIKANPAARRSGSRKNRLIQMAPAEQRQDEIKALTRLELSAFLTATLEKEPRHYPMFFTMARTGMRLGEAFGLQWNDLDFSAREIRVARGMSGGRVEAPKNGKGRTVDMSLALRDVLQRHDAATKAQAFTHGQERSVWCFPSLEGTTLDRANVEKAFKRALDKAGLPAHFTPHSLRHTFASLLLQQGESPAYVQRQLGHSSIKLTVDTYGRWLPMGNLGAVDRLDDAPPPLQDAVVAKRPESGSRGVRKSPQVVGGPRGDRTPDLLIANQALCQTELAARLQKRNCSRPFQAVATRSGAGLGGVTAINPVVDVYQPSC